MKTYLRDIHRCPALPKDEQLRLGRLSRRGDRAARDQLIQSILPLVVSIATRVQKTHPHCALEDLVQVGNAAAIRAVDHYQPRRNCALTTLSHLLIRRDILKFANEDRLIRIPGYQFTTYRNPRHATAVSRALIASSLEGSPLTCETTPTDDADEASRERDLFHWALAQIRPRDREVILKRCEGRTLQDIAGDYGLNKERIRQISDRAINHIKAILTKRGK